MDRIKIQNLEVYFCFLSTYYDRSRTDEKHIRICFTAAFNKHKDKGGNEHGESFIEYRSSTRSKRRSGQIEQQERQMSGGSSGQY